MLIIILRTAIITVIKEIGGFDHISSTAVIIPKIAAKHGL